MIVQSATLSDLILAVAKAGGVAISSLSTPENPVGLSEFSVELKFSCTFNVSSDTTLQLQYYMLSVEEKIKFDYQEELGLTVKMVLRPLPTSEQSSAG